MKNTLITLGAIAVLGVGAVALTTESAPLLSNEEAKAQGLMLVVVDKKTGDIIPDFQSNATLGVLKENAIRAGKKSIDVEEKWITQAEYKIAEDAFMAQTTAQRETERAQKQAQLNTLTLKARATWTDQELFDLQELILQGLRFNPNPQH